MEEIDDSPLQTEGKILFVVSFVLQLRANLEDCRKPPWKIQVIIINS